MNRNDALCLLTALDRFRPAYAEWRSEQANKLAAMHRTTIAEESRAMIDSIARTLSEVTTAEAAAVVEGMESGAVAVPFWGEMAATIRRESFADRRAREESAAYSKPAERLTCLDCRDNGYVVIFNPYFVRDFRSEFERFDNIPPRFFALIVRWWRENADRQHLGAISHAALCDCSCKRQGILASELTKFERGERKTKKGEPAGPPACGTAHWNRHWSPVWPSNMDGELFDALARFYAGEFRRTRAIESHPNYRPEFDN
jgi:hypothetical protein